jgi:hypothetical protein
MAHLRPSAGTIDHVESARARRTDDGSVDPSRSPDIAKPPYHRCPHAKGDCGLQSTFTTRHSVSMCQAGPPQQDYKGPKRVSENLLSVHCHPTHGFSNRCLPAAFLDWALQSMSIWCFGRLVALLWQTDGIRVACSAAKSRFLTTDSLLRKRAFAINRARCR